MSRFVKVLWQVPRSAFLRWALTRTSAVGGALAMLGVLLGVRSVVRSEPVLALSVNFAPGSGTRFTIPNETIQVSGCDTFYQIEDAIITINGNGVSYTTQPPGSGNCATSYSRRFDITGPGFTPGANTVVATVFNANGDEQTASVTYYYDEYAVQVTGGVGPTVAPGATGTAPFTVSNTGGTDATADLSVSCPALASCAITGSDPLPINHGQSLPVNVSFTAGPSDGTPVITLTATYVESSSTTDSDGVTVSVRTPVDHVGIQPSPPIQVGVGQTTTLTGTAYDANNNVLTGRTITWSTANSGIATVSPSAGTSTTLLGESAGGTTVTATSEGKSTTSNVSVGSVVGPTVSFEPPGNTHFTNPSTQLIVRGCHATLPVTDAILTLNGVGLSYTRFEGSTACSGGFGAEFRSNVTLPQHQNTFAATVSVNNGAASTGSSATYFYDNYAVSVTPDGAVGDTLARGTPDSLSFVVTNTGNVQGTLGISANCPSGFSDCSTSTPLQFTLDSAGFQNVKVYYTAGQADGNHTVGLTATYLAPGTGSDAGSYTVTVIPPPDVVASVDVVLNASTIAPGAHTVATATLRRSDGTPITGQSVTWSSSAPSVATASSTGALTADVAAVAVGTAYIRAQASNGVKDSALVTVSTSIPPAVIAATNAGLNPEDALARDLCLTASLGPDAASECGDLRVVHALPAVLVKSVRQQPALIYSSAMAHPHPLVGVNVMYTSGTRPDSVEALLRVNGVLKRRAAWLGSSLLLNVARRLVIGYDAIPSGSGDPTGVYPYTVEIAPFNAGVRGTPVTVSGRLALVNRSQSRFGPGWWLAGLEQLFTQADGSLLWVGGDGSARRYASVTANLWVPQQLEFPDTIRLASGKYTRYAPKGVKIRFNSAGNHVATVRALGDSTWFFYTVSGLTPRLDTIRTLISSRYGFGYNANGRLTSISAPLAPGVVRLTSIGIGANGEVATITDPEQHIVGFGYHPTFTRRITSRTDRRATTTTFSYDGGWKISQSSSAMDAPTPPIVTQLTAAETKGLAAATGLSNLADTAAAYTMIDGPRTDVGDSTKFWLDLRFGAPHRIQDALGFTTLLERGNATYPALVTRVQRANGHVQRYEYDQRGHVHLAIDSGGIVAGREETTRYEWNDTFDAVERIVPQMSDSTVFAYDPANGNLIWQQDARGVSSRVNFRYYPANVNVRHLLRAIQYPTGSGTVVDSFAYDIRLNLNYSRSPLGFVTTVHRDNAGRDTLTISPIDATHTLRHRKVFDLVDQVTREATVGSGPITYTLSGSGLTPDTAAVRNDSLVRIYTYDNEGNRTSVSSYSTGGKTDVGTAETYTYDRANRLLTKDAGSGPRALTYDPAGNAIVQQYSTGMSVTQQFDALNRLTKRIVPQRDFGQQRCQGFPVGPISQPTGGLGCRLVFPYYPNNGAGYRIAADTSVFVYDNVGNTVQANNRFARIKRSYTPYGLLATDSLIFGSYSNPAVDAERRGQSFTYDRNGRRSTMAWLLGTTNYDYATPSVMNFGPLQQVTDPTGAMYRLRHDEQGRVDSLVIAASGGVVGVREKRTYDFDGRIVRRERASTNPGIGQLNLDSLFYDQRGKVSRARMYSRAQQTQGVRYTYDPPGGVVVQEFTRDLGGYQVEEFRNDAYGNVFYQRTRSSAGTNDAPMVSAYAPDGLLLNRFAALPQVPTQNQFEEETDQTSLGSDVTITSRIVKQAPMNGGAAISQLASRSFYSADSRLMVVQRYDEKISSSVAVGTWEEYRYDALGRRILTRARRDFLATPDSSNTLCLDPTGGSCGSYAERTIWDGDQLLYEWRVPEASPTGMTSGSAGYVHVEGIDQPTGLIRPEGTRVVNYTWRGLGESSVFVNGSSGDCAIPFSGCTAVEWPAKAQGSVYYTPNLVGGSANGPYTWFGTLAANGGGSSGMLYRRNRYFDPVSGRFTQQDPIGVAGGMNLYGFADGDPVNFSDPFGLCPQCLTGLASVAVGYTIARLTGQEYGLGSAALDFAVGAATAGASLAGKVGAASKLLSGVRILEQEGDLVMGAFKVAKGEARFIGQMVQEGKTLILRGAHVEGNATMSEIKAAARAFGKEGGFEKVIIEGGKRTTGRNPGHFPKPITIDVP